MDPIFAVPVEVPTQVLIYRTEEPDIFQGAAQSAADGTITIDVPILQAPPEGTPIQIIIYVDPENPTLIEGLTNDDGGSGSIGIDIPDEILE